MLEACIVAAARSPIGRASKGSPKDVRPKAFAARVIPSARELNIAPEDSVKLNVNSGAGAHGEVRGRQAETMRVGGGPGIAMILERLS
ncbi:hypothetical protein EV191_10656 [Tamaricihabitans halophyticus]|uniref:Thiolase-like protein n=1 Tax=Tamaricihabitans halophyticus TaxID=1262583 RepID=A0A4R2QQ84_9PSEU|nr:hypothetical protein EV191_10656 [Tamaricihabitans halophyticus]